MDEPGKHLTHKSLIPRPQRLQVVQECDRPIQALIDQSELPPANVTITVDEHDVLDEEELTANNCAVPGKIQLEVDRSSCRVGVVHAIREMDRLHEVRVNKAELVNELLVRDKQHRKDHHVNVVGPVDSAALVAAV